jgi:hypothetical protein
MPLIFALAICTAAGCGEQSPADQAISAINEADKIEIYSMVSGDMIDFRAAYPEEDLFYGNLILGKAEVRAASTRKQLVTAFQEAIDEAPDGPALCFYPRHGLRIHIGDEVIDLVICFECWAVNVFLNGSTEADSWFVIADRPKEVFDQICTEYGLILESEWLNLQKDQRVD